MSVRGQRITGSEGVAERSTTRRVVAVVLTWRHRVGLFKRSRLVAHDAGAWHCIAGYVDRGRTPIQQAAEELWEETGLCVVDLEQLDSGPVLQLPVARDDRPWTVHTFVANSRERRLQLSWEHDKYRWVRPERVKRFDGRVAWLADVLEAALPLASGSPMHRSWRGDTTSWCRETA